MARFYLRLSDVEFFDLTPRQFHLLVKCHREQSEYQEYLAGLISATIGNFSFAAPKRTLLPTDFMASRVERAGRQEEAPPELVAQNIRCFLRGQMAAQKGSHGTDNYRS